VLLVHAGLAALILSGLDVRTVVRTVERLKTFDVLVPPPPPPPPPPQQLRARAKDQEGAAGKKARPTPIVAPVPKIIIPAKPPVIAATVASTGSAPTAGAENAGTGTGAGGSGTGLGGGGSGGSGGGLSAGARWLSGGLFDSDNRGGRFEGVVAVKFIVLTNGRVDRCRVTRASGNRDLDGLTCRLLEQRLRFSPARNMAGRPVASEVGTTYTWGVRRRRSF
jgi:protein TonB